MRKNRIKKYATLYILVLTFFVLAPQSLIKADTYIDSGEISTDVTWAKAGSPYIIDDSLVISPSATLTLEPGVSVKVRSNTTTGDWVDIFGTINARGTEQEPIIFDVDEESLARGIRLYFGSSINNKFDHVEFNNVISLNFDNSEAEIANGKIVGDAGPTIYNNGFVSIDNVSIDGLFRGPIKVFNSGHAYVSNSTLSGPLGAYSYIYNSSDIHFIDTTYNGNIELFNSSVLDASTSSFFGGPSSYTATFEIYGQSSVTIASSTIENDLGYGFYVYGESSATISDSTIQNGFDGIHVFGNSNILVERSEIKDFENAGVAGYFANVNVAESKITENGAGFDFFTTIENPGQITVSQSNIIDNDAGVIWDNYDNNPSVFDAKNNWWGDRSGPYHELNNPDGRGDSVSGPVEISPWLESDPGAVECCSNVVFIPGLESSRLYKKGNLLENQLWEPNRNADVEKLYLDSNGNSIDASIYTRDILKRTNIGFGAVDQNIYKSFSDEMDKLVEEKKINMWKALPYDWRFDFEKIISEGVKLENGQMLNFIDEIRKLSQSSDTGKVTIVTHSNGGLLAKVLINKLKELGEEDLVDRLIMVAAPQLGTPSAVAGLLHGEGQEIAGGMMLSEEVARTLGENMMGAYNLLPQEKYFEKVSTPVIRFGVEVDKISNVRQKYGDEIDGALELRDFLLGADGRKEPKNSDSETPNVLKTNLLDRAETNHSVLDNWMPPENIKVTELVGWGVKTISGIKYGTRVKCMDNMSSCFPVTVFDPRPIVSEDGDKTVVAPSASAVGNDVWYLDMKNIMQTTGKRIDHKSILENISVLNFLKNYILESDEDVSLSVKKEKPVSTDKTLELALHSPVSIDVTDKDGNHTGSVFNSNSESDLVIIEEGIPGSRYMEFGEGKYVWLDQEKDYSIKLQGLDSGTFTLEMSTLSSEGDVLEQQKFVDIPTSAETKGEIEIASSQNGDTTVTLLLDIDGDGKKDFDIKPSEDIDPILYLQILRKTIQNLDASSVIKKIVIRKIDLIIKSLQKKKTKTAIIKIRQFIKKLTLGEKKMEYERGSTKWGKSQGWMSELKNHWYKKNKLSREDSDMLLQMINQLLNTLTN